MKHLILAALLLGILACGSPGSHPEPKLAGEWSVAARFHDRVRCTGDMDISGPNAALVGTIAFECMNVETRETTPATGGAIIASAFGWDGASGMFAGHIEWSDPSPTGRFIDVIDGIYDADVVSIDIGETGTLEASAR